MCTHLVPHFLKISIDCETKIKFIEKKSDREKKQSRESTHTSFANKSYLHLRSPIVNIDTCVFVYFLKMKVGHLLKRYPI
jgi:hypothetical protein